MVNGNPRFLNRRSFLLGSVALAGGIGSAVLTRAADPAVTIYRGPTTVPIVALTFDGGSNAGHCAMILNTLAQNQIKATFPLTGQFAVSYPALVRRIVDEGHQLVNHSFSHPSFTGVTTSHSVLTTAARVEQLDSTEEAFVNAGGVTTRPWFRPPYGDINAGVLADLGNAGFSNCLMWSIDLLGWNGYTQNQIVNRVNANHGNGYIYLMHVGSDSQEGPALPRIITLLQEKGYGFATVADMLSGNLPPSTPTPAAFEAGDTVRIVNPLNLRTAPNLGGRVIVTMAQNTTATVASGPVPADGYVWYQLNTQHGIGWAATISLVKVTTPPPTPAPGGFAAGDTVRVTAGLYLRSAPSLTSSVYVTMPTGTTCTILGGPSPAGGYTWYQVETPYGTGWAAGEFLVKVAVPTTPEPTPTEPSTPDPTPTEPSTPSPTPGGSGFANGDTIRVTANLFLRSSPSLNGQVRATMPNGTLCTIVGGPSPSSGYTWYEVQSTYGTGWAAGEYMVKSSGTAPTPTPQPGAWPAGTRARVTQNLNLRATASTSGRLLTTMAVGTIVTVLSGPQSANGYTWYQVQSSYGSGWVANQWLVRI